MNFEAIVAALLGEPFRLRFAEIADLTDRQIYDLYCHPRNKEGQIDFQVGHFRAKDMTADEELLAVKQLAAALGMSDAKIKELEEKARGRRGETATGKAS